MSLKLVLVWAAGALFMLGGSWITGNLEATVGVTPVSYYMALVAALVMFLMAGICWIAVAVAAKSHWKF
jgi:hypothetical protein